VLLHIVKHRVRAFIMVSVSLGLQTLANVSPQRLVRRNNLWRLQRSCSLVMGNKIPQGLTTCSLDNTHDQAGSEEFDGSVSDSQVSNLRGKFNRRGIPPTLPTLRAQTDTGSALRKTLSGELPGEAKSVLC
jgi:hypothetical protein